MKERLARLHQSVVDALVEADAIRDLDADRPDAVPMNDVGISLDKARAVLEQMVWPDRSNDHRPLQ